MKKSSILLSGFIFLFIISGYAKDMSLIGGSARLMSMGNPEAVVADSVSNFDLYEIGFDSAIFTRPAKSVLYLYPGFSLKFRKIVESDSSQRTEEDSGFDLSNGTYKYKNNGFVIFPSPDLAIIIKPYTLYGIITEKNIYPSIPSSNYEEEIKSTVLNGEIGVAYNFNKKIAFGLDIGYSAYVLSLLDKNDNDLEQPSFRKFIYDISASYYMDGPNGWIFSLSGGNKTLPGPIPSIELNYGYELLEFYMFDAIMENLYSLNTYTEDYSPSSIIKRWTDINAKGFNINIGAGKQGSGATSFAAKGGVALGIGGDYKVKEDDNGVVTENSATDVFKDGFGLNGEIALRFDMGTVIPALKGKIANTNYKQRFGSIYIDNGILTFKISSGLSFVLSDSIMLPVELFYEGIKQSMKSGSIEMVYYIMDLGLKAGTEIAINKDFFLRFGSDYAYGGYQMMYYVDGAYNSGSPGIGTTDNLAMTQIAINGGVGFKLASSVETNIGLRYEILGFNKENPGYSSYSNNNIILQTDLKIIL